MRGAGESGRLQREQREHREQRCGAQRCSVALCARARVRFPVWRGAARREGATVLLSLDRIRSVRMQPTCCTKSYHVRPLQASSCVDGMMDGWTRSMLKQLDPYLLTLRALPARNLASASPVQFIDGVTISKKRRSSGKKDAPIELGGKKGGKMREAAPPLLYVCRGFLCEYVWSR